MQTDPLGFGAMDQLEVRVGTAGWTVPRDVRERFGGDGSQLERYAQRFSCVEINSSFYRPHRPSTYARWAATVSDNFRFALKIPKEITHVRRFVDAVDPFERFLAESAPLGHKRGVLLVQLPPSFAYAATLTEAFFTMVRARYDGLLACEPRHASWFAPDAGDALRRFAAARVAADPAIVPQAAIPGGWDGLAYYRLHGAPRTYYSAYDDAALRSVADRLRRGTSPAWCIFDNTTLGAATANALDVTELLGPVRKSGA